MNNEQDKTAPEQAAGADIAPHAGQGRTSAPGRRAEPRPFNWPRSVMDDKTACADKPEAAKPALIGSRLMPSYYVPVSFVAKDWNVTPRRIRALLSAGRLAGRVRDNGYWEVVFPYSYIFGTRGPGLKRQKKPALRAV